MLNAASHDEDPTEAVHERPRRTGPNKRPATKQKVNVSKGYLDGRDTRIRPGGDNIAFVYEYKAAHKFAAENLKRALPNERLFMKATNLVCSTKSERDPELNERDAADVQVAMVLTQVFHYMVTHGVAYGYIAAGNSLVFLHTKPEDLRTLYYYLCIPDAGEISVIDTAVAQLANFCLLTVRSEALPDSVTEKTIEEAELQEWGCPCKESPNLLQTETSLSSQSVLSTQRTTGSVYVPDSEEEGPTTVREISLRSRSTCKDAATSRKNNDNDSDDDNEQDDNRFRVLGMPGTTSAAKRKEGPSSSSSEGSNHNTSSGSDSPPTKQYCTQARLLGLKRECDLDEYCPNVSSHRTVESGTKHPINAIEFASLVREQVSQNPYRYCIALDPFDLLGKIGAIGALFKLELAQYGYTFVGKGTQPAHLCHLQHESLVYSRLEGLQGEVVPVYLGLISLESGYFLPGAVRVFHMMLMSWGGEVAAGAGVPNMAAELKRSRRALWNEGVFHGDERAPNILWNEERGRIMLIDFDRATLHSVRYKHAPRVSGKKRKRDRLSSGRK